MTTEIVLADLPDSEFSTQTYATLAAKADAVLSLVNTKAALTSLLEDASTPARRGVSVSFMAYQCFFVPLNASGDGLVAQCGTRLLAKAAQVGD